MEDNLMSVDDFSQHSSSRDSYLLLIKSLCQRRISPYTGSKQSDGKTPQENEDDVMWRLNLRSSSCFDKVMDDIEDKVVLKIKKQREIEKQRELVRRETEKKINIKTDNNEDDKTVDAKPEPEPEIKVEDSESYDIGDDTATDPLTIKARRAWKLIKRYIREQAMKHKKKKSALQWNVLHHTMKNMSNLDSAREELYTKYLNPPNPRSWTEGISSIPAGFFNKRSDRVDRGDPEDSPQTTSKPKSSVYFYKRPTGAKSAVLSKHVTVRPSRSVVTTAKTVRSSRTWYI